MGTKHTRTHVMKLNFIVLLPDHKRSSGSIPSRLRRRRRQEGRVANPSVKKSPSRGGGATCQPNRMTDAVYQLPKPRGSDSENKTKQ